MDTPASIWPARGARLILRAVVMMGIYVALCVGGALAGWRQLWLFLGLTLLILAINLAVIWRRNPGLLWERLKPDRPEKRWDLAVLVSADVAALAIFLVAGLDVMRLHLSTISPGETAFGVALFLGGDALVAWCMGENPFLERTVRIQQERSHRVITTGPYQFVRHPMYVGFIVMTLGWPLVLGSWWALVPTLVMDALLVVRTHFEDKTLHDELPGYREYAAKTRYRLLPGIW